MSRGSSVKRASRAAGPCSDRLSMRAHAAAEGWEDPEARAPASRAAARVEYVRRDKLADAWSWERRPRRAAARTRRGGIAERHAPGGELLRDDGGHLDFRRRCLKRVVCAGMAWVGGEHNKNAFGEESV